VDKTILKRRFDTAKAIKQREQKEIEDCYLYVDPEGWTDNEEEADDSLIYDSTARDACQTLHANLMNFLVPRDSEWAKFDSSTAIKDNGIPYDVRLKLEKSTDVYFDNINNSNFHIAAGEANWDTVVGGTGCYERHLGDKSQMCYRAINIKKLYILENGHGVIDTVFLEHAYPARHIVENKDWDTPQEVQDQHDENPDKPIKVIECQIPFKGGFRYSVHLESNWHELYSLTVDYAPFTVFRWSKRAGRVWGLSPVYTVLADIKVSNELVRILLEASEYAAKGAWTTEDPAIAKRGLIPGGVMHTTSELHPVQFPGNLNVAMKDLEFYRQQIREGLFANALPPIQESGAMTATEASMRQAQFVRKIGQPAQRLEREELYEGVKADIGLMQHAKILPAFPLDGKTIKITVSSMVKRAQDMEEVNRNFQLIQMLLPFGEQALSQINLPKFIRDTLEKGGFSPSLLKDPDEAQQSEQMFQLATMIQQVMPAMMQAQKRS
jgi:hypothetical protein